MLKSISINSSCSSSSSSSSSKSSKWYFSAELRARYKPQTLPSAYLAQLRRQRPGYKKKIRYPWKQQVVLNEYNEPISNFGQWLPRAKETLYVRDRRIWQQEMANIRRKYKQEYYDKFRQRLAEYTRMTDEQMYREALKEAQKRERTRLRNIRIGALEAANQATQARMRMDREKVRNILDFDIRDQRRDVIREMIWEKPSKNWITKENFHELDMKFLDFVDECHPGLPKPGEYDMVDSIFRHSDLYFGPDRKIRKDQELTTITKQPVRWKTRADDTLQEFEAESAPWASPSYTPYKEESIEYEQKANNLLPNYWYNLDWEKGIQEREEKQLSRSPIFKEAELIEYELDPYEDFFFMKQPKYWSLLKNAQTLNSSQIIEYLSDIFKASLPPDAHKHTGFSEEEYKEKFVEKMLPKILNKDWEERRERDEHYKKWNLYKDFHDRINHYRQLPWQAGKMNFDVGLEKWRQEVVKWRYLIFESQEEHIQWRERLRTVNLSSEDVELCRAALIQLRHLENLLIERRVDMPTLESFLKEIDANTMKVFYIWLEELTEKGETIALGEGWSFNRYHDLPAKARIPEPTQVPVEYFQNPYLHNPELPHMRSH